MPYALGELVWQCQGQRATMGKQDKDGVPIPEVRNNAERIVDRFIAELEHEHCSWDVPGGCDGVCDCHVEGIQAAWSHMMGDVSALREALQTLVEMYVANRGSDGEFPHVHEFISCITPPHASEMTRGERQLSKTWAAWDAARRALGEKIDHSQARSEDG